MPAAAPLFLDRSTVVYKLDPADAPRLTLEGGGEIMVATHDARAGRLKRAEDVMATAPDFRDPYPQTNPATGPISVTGAEPGDALVVDILGIEVDDYGFLIVKPDFGLVQGLVNQPVARIVPVEDGVCRFGDLHFPVRPMMGVIATALADGPVGTAFCGRHGGNMDNNRVCAGTRVFLPVRVPGAHLYVGDVHASMGDGELCGTGVEIGARVHLRVTVAKGAGRDWPWLETPELLITTASAPAYEAAAEIAVREMLAMLGERLGLSPPDAMMLISAVGHIRVNQSCRGGPIDTSVRCEMPKLNAGLTRAVEPA